MTGWHREPLNLAVVDLDRHTLHSGIGRVLASLAARWKDSIRVADAEFIRIGLPGLRNFPVGVRTDGATDVVLLPQLTGAEALARTGGIPSVVIVHDIGIVDCPEDQEQRPWLSTFKVKRSFRALGRAASIVAISEFSRRRLILHSPELENKITVIPNGVDERFLLHARSRSEARKRLEKEGVELRSPLIIYVGSEIRRKNVPLLIEVFCRLRETHPEAQLIKVGKPGAERFREETHALLRTHRLVPGRDVIFLENLADDSLADAYRAADLFLSTSLYEGFGMPALEAMAVGTPVVVTDRAAFPEVVCGAGWLVAPDPEAMAQAAREALAGTARTQRGRERAAAFSWERAAAKYLQLFDNLRHRRAS